ncbi:MAG: hypothetical protein KDK74_08120 [Cephaloticoccus sp.]|nr:hypothetical protein [Cephaloticoccus sp.]
MANKPPTTHQAALAAYHTLKDEGLLPPCTAEEIAALEEEIGLYPKPPLTAEAALKYAKGLVPLPEISPPATFTELHYTIEQEFGIAARGSSDIPEAVWAKMKQDRKEARHGRAKENS